MGKSSKFLEHLEKGLTSSKLKCNFSLAKLTSFRVGGPAKAIVEVNNLNDLGFIYQLANEYEVPLFFLGRGTNILASDAGYDGLIISLGQPFKKLSLNGDKLVVGAGANLSRVVQFAAKNGLDGLAFAVGIPGTVGGAICGNAGAFGQEIAEIISRVTVYQNNRLEVFHQNDLSFSYRESNLKQLLIVEAEFKLQPEKREVIKTKMQAYLKKRKETQPSKSYTAGSVFKNPPGYFAGQLIEQCGGKKWQIGGAQVSAKHANFFINTGNARAIDIYRLIIKAKQEVYARFKVKLEPEIKFLGQWPEEIMELS